MRINPIQFNFIQTKSQNRGNSPLRMSNPLKADVVNFTGFNRETPDNKMAKLVPKHKGLIYKKVYDENDNVVDKIPVEVDIVKAEPRLFQFKKDGDIIGYVRLNYVPEEECSEDNPCSLYKNYKEEGITGARIEVEMIRNAKDDEYGGIGHLGDLIEVAACKELGIKPNIISLSFDDVAPLHYSRGKRFIPYEKYSTPSEMEIFDLAGEKPNDTVREIVENTSKDECYDTSSIKTPFLVAYMPKEMVQKLEEELKGHPIF